MKLVEVYDRNAGYWDSWLYRTVYFRPYIRLLHTLKREGGLGRPVRVLDCGIGAGLLSEAFLHIADWRTALNGIDISSKLLTISAAKFNGHGTQARLVLGDICRLPYRNEEMDLVLSGLVLEHVPLPLDAVRENGASAAPPRATDTRRDTAWCARSLLPLEVPLQTLSGRGHLRLDESSWPDRSSFPTFVRNRAFLRARIHRNESVIDLSAT